MNRQLSLVILLGLIVATGHAAIWHVGATQNYTLPSQISALVNNGDTIYIDGGFYFNDAVKWTKRDLKIIGLGTDNNRSVLQYTGDIPNGKGIFVFETPGACDNAYIENIVFDGAQVSDANGANGAGIRFQAKNLTVINCIFMNCQNGILEGHGSVNTSNVTILNTEFYNNGYQLPNSEYSGYEHHIYISASADTLLVSNCYFHHPRGQANSLKTRAQRSYILYNMIDEEATGYGSWELNIAQGGLNIIMGNIIIQGAFGANHGVVGYDAATNELEDFYFVNNTVINRFEGNVKYFNVAPSSGINTFKIYNNIFASITGASTTMFSGNTPSVLESANNVNSSDYMNIGFTNAGMNDFSLSSDALLMINQGIDAGLTNTLYPLVPVRMYQFYTSELLPRAIDGGTIDIGAYEFDESSDIAMNEFTPGISVYPNPANGMVHFTLNNIPADNNCLMEIFNESGQKIYSESNLKGQLITTIDLSIYPKGLYTIRLYVARGIYSGKILIQ